MTTECACDLGAAQGHFVGGVALDDIDVVEGGVILLVGQHDFVGHVVDDHDRPRVVDDAAVHLADEVQRSRRPVEQDQMVGHFEMGHFATPQ
jgi:hypothetical protein